MAMNEQRQRLMQELSNIGFAAVAMAELVGTAGNYPGQNAKNIAIGINARVKCLVREFDALLDDLTAKAVAAQLSNQQGPRDAIAAGAAAQQSPAKAAAAILQGGGLVGGMHGPQWTPEEMQKIKMIKMKQTSIEKIDAWQPPIAYLAKDSL